MTHTAPPIAQASDAHRFPQPTELPPAAPRRHLHTREVVYRGYLRDDGLWDIEGELKDSKTHPMELGFRGTLPEGAAVHGIKIRLTVDDDMVIHDVAAAMPFTPYLECRPATDPIRALIGLQMGPGWKGKIEKAIGGLVSCTHVRELLSNAATAAYQTVFPYRNQTSPIPLHQVTEPPKHLNQCIGWDLKGSVALHYYPQFAQSGEER